MRGEDAAMLAGLAKLREAFDGMNPLFDTVVAKAKESGHMGLAFSTLHLTSSVEVFYQELEKFILEKVNEGDA